MNELNKQRVINALENLSDYISRTINIIQMHEDEIAASEVWIDNLEQDATSAESTA